MSGSTHPTKPKRGAQFKSLGDVLSDVYSEMDGLKDELQEWLDNMPQNLQGGSKASEIQEAIDALESVDEIECPTELEKMEVTWVESTKKRKSRADRRDDCTAALSAAIDTIRGRDDADDYGALVDEITQAMEEYEAVEFPGMH